LIGSSGDSYERRVFTLASARAESAHSVTRVTVAIPPQHISKH